MPRRRALNLSGAESVWNAKVRSTQERRGGGDEAEEQAMAGHSDHVWTTIVSSVSACSVKYAKSAVHGYILLVKTAI